MVRAVLASVLGPVGAAVLFFWFAGAFSGQPWVPEERREIDLAELQSTTSRLQLSGQGLRIDDLETGSGSLMIQPFAPFAASRYRYFRVHIDDAGAEQRALLVLRSEGRTTTAPLPGGLRGEVILDLAEVPAWQGEIDAVGLFIVAADFLAAAEAPRRSPLLRTAVLESPSRLGAARALWVRWTGYRPLTGRSINTAGLEFGARAGPSLPTFVAVLAAWSAGVLWLGGVRRWRARCIQVVGIACALLAFGQIVQWALRAEVAANAWSSVEDDSAWPLAASPPLAHEALQLQQHLVGQPPPRLLVWSSERFQAEYTVWLLRRFNVAFWPPWLPLPGGAVRDDEPLQVVMVGQQGWQFDAERRYLLVGEQTLVATPMWKGKDMRLFRVDGEVAR